VCVSVFEFPLSSLGDSSVKIPLIVARQRFDENPPIVAWRQLGRNVTAVTNTHAAVELLDASF
jgi:hypothetical protein